MWSLSAGVNTPGGSDPVPLGKYPTLPTYKRVGLEREWLAHASAWVL